MESNNSDTKSQANFMPGPCVWNGNEIVLQAVPDVGIAGIAPNIPDAWGFLFAVAPEMYEELRESQLMIAFLLATYADQINGKCLKSMVERLEAGKVILSKARGESC